jgi:hypothetical protein
MTTEEGITPDKEEDVEGHMHRQTSTDEATNEDVEGHIRRRTATDDAADEDVEEVEDDEDVEGHMRRRV